MTTQLYLVLCESEQGGQRWYEMTVDPIYVPDGIVHFGPAETSEDYHSVMDAAVSLANENSFALDDEDTWPLEE